MVSCTQPVPGSSLHADAEEAGHAVSAGHIFDRSSIEGWLRNLHKSSELIRKANNHIDTRERSQQPSPARPSTPSSSSSSSDSSKAPWRKNATEPRADGSLAPSTPEQVVLRPRNSRFNCNRESSPASASRTTMFYGSSLDEVQKALRGSILGFMLEACKELLARWHLASSGEAEYAYDPASSGLITDLATALVQRGQDSAGNFQALGLQLIAAWLEDPPNREEGVRVSLWAAVHQVIIESAESRGPNAEVAAAGCHIIRHLVSHEASSPPDPDGAPLVPVQVVRTVAYGLHFHPRDGEVVRAARDALHAIPAETWKKWDPEPRQCACATFLCVLRRALLDNGSGLFGDLELLGSVLEAALVPLELHGGQKVARKWMELGIETLAELGDSSGRLTAASLRLINNYLLLLPSSDPLEDALPAHPEALQEVKDIARLHARNPAVILEVCFYLQALAARSRLHASELVRMGFLRDLRRVLDAHNRRPTPARAAVLFEASRAVEDLVRQGREQLLQQQQQEEEDEEADGESCSGLERALGAVMDRMHGSHGAEGYRLVVFEAAKRAMEAIRPMSGFSRSMLLNRNGWVGVGADAAALAVGAVALECCWCCRGEDGPLSTRRKQRRQRRLLGNKKKRRAAASSGVLLDLGVAAFYDVSGRAALGASAPTALGLVIASQEEPDVIPVFFGSAMLLMLLLKKSR